MFTFNFLSVLVGVVLLSGISSVTGCFALLNKRSLISDAIAHGILPGICLGFLFVGEKNYLAILVGGFLAGWLSMFLTDEVIHRTKIKPDTSIAIFLSLFFGIGLMILSHIQQSEYADKSGINTFLFGNTSAILPKDLFVFFFTGVIVLAIIILFFRGFKSLIFDKEFSQSIGFPIKLLQLLLSTIIIFSIVIGIQSVGMVLIAALLITPASTAKFWFLNVRSLLVATFVISAFASTIGVFLSVQYSKIATGPIIVLILSVLFVISILSAPKRGILSQIIQQRKNTYKIRSENILKFFLKKSPALKVLSENEIREADLLKGYNTSRLLKKLKREGFLIRIKKSWQLSEKGKERAKRIVKLHRLWEVYLATKLSLPKDHLHEDAETIEHIITPKLEKVLEKGLNYPKTDPHKSPIEYS